ncbi:uncharacterized protein LOC113284439 isoform X1 [Papaver somniferum]|uniref:uncharacterized protein LOC113284439 isoform X1 n=2 Tax=Papaver somniferum TaxID=3469 RepID=UPI000E6F668C|nr:uncharacterized protein LOC113284439 isoform X1 [Papaver somniferum]XP_026389683.1 uncharacterized protein LOC113284439 isoform X1 [Papaver somniferum]
MMVVDNSFDLWQKDVFFSAAEEVQNSADIMESVYRTWVRETKEGLESDDYSVELRREVQTALGTAKWQLDEFERAVRLSHRIEDNRTTRHKQFISVIEGQIARVETALKEALNEEGNEPLRWVNLDEEERDDLAAFLSGSSPGTSQSGTDDSVESGSVKDVHLCGVGGGANEKEIVECKRKGFKEVLTINKDAKYVVELETKEISGAGDDVNCQAERSAGQTRMWGSPNFGDWKIVIADEDDKRKKLVSEDESTNKGKVLKSSFWRQRGEVLPQTNGGISSSRDIRGVRRLTQLVSRLGGCRRQSQSPRHMKFRSPVRVTLLVMLTIILIVPFLFYSA